jgi:hypothetical protein
VNLNWATASEINSAFFTIYKSADTLTWVELSTIPGAGNSNHIVNYSVADNDYQGNISYYQLKQMDYDGKSTLFNILSADCPKVNNLMVTIYPNPFNTFTTISMNDASNIIKTELKICDALGSEVINTILSNQITTLETNNLPSGIYFYKIIQNDKIIQSGKLISQ